jgi:hypothetical protein
VTVVRLADERELSDDDRKYTGRKGFVVKSELKVWRE